MDGRLDNILLKLKSGNSITNDERDYIRSKISFYDDTEELEQAIRSFGLACSPTLDNIKIIEIGEIIAINYFSSNIIEFIFIKLKTIRRRLRIVRNTNCSFFCTWRVSS